MEKETIKALAETTARATAAALVGNAKSVTQDEVKEIVRSGKTSKKEVEAELRRRGYDSQSIKQYWLSPSGVNMPGTDY